MSSSPPRPSGPIAQPEPVGSAPSASPSDGWSARVAARIADDAPALAERWIEQARGQGFPAAQATGADTAAALVRAFAETIGRDGPAPERVLSLGLGVGGLAFEQGASLHATLKAVGLLGAMVAYALERAVEGSRHGSATDGVRLARRLAEAQSFATLAVGRGYTQAMSDGMRDRLRHLRHDLRNPLGTIKSVLSLMEDESVGAAGRGDPKFLAMAGRNTRNLEAMITARLAEGTAFPSLAQQAVSLRTVACAVRRDLRADAEARDVEVTVGRAADPVRLDVAGFELVLRSALQAVLQHGQAGEEVHVALEPPSGGRARVTLSCEPARAPVPDAAALERIVTLARQLGAKVSHDDALAIVIPVVESAPSADRAVQTPTTPGPADARAPRASGGHARDDVRGAGEREHRQP